MKNPISRFTVNGRSMTPTLKEGQDILSINWFYSPKVGDVVVIKQSGKEMVKRIEKIDRDKIYVIGDKLDESTDSREFGPILKENILGKVVYGPNQIDCPSCSSPVIGIYGRKDAICQNCGFKLACCGEP